MSITISQIEANAPSGGVGQVSYLVKIDGTTKWARTGANFSSAYCGMPAVNADQSARSVDATNVYVGIGAFDIAARDVTDWGSPPPYLDTNGDVAAPDLSKWYSPGLTSDTSAVAAIAAAASDSGVIAAAMAALAAGNPPADYAVATELRLFPNGSSTPTIPIIDSTHPQTTTPAVANGDWLTVAPLDPSNAVPATADYLSVTWTSSNHSVLTLTPGATLGPADTNLTVTIATVGSGSATITATVVSIATASPGMVLSVNVTVP